MYYRECEELNQKLSTLGPVWVYIREYRLTHGYLHLLLTDKGFKRQADVYMTDCTFISGPPSGGPWQLDATEVEEDGQKPLKISGAEDKFVAKALRAQLSFPEAES